MAAPAGSPCETGFALPYDMDTEDQQHSRSGDESGSEGSPRTLTSADVKRLGRQRPAVLDRNLTEAGFVTTVVLSMMLSEFSIGGFNIVLPPVADALAIPPSQRTWPAGVTNLTTAALLLPMARLCDMYGGRPVFLAGQAWLAAWSLVAGFSPSPAVLIACRAMQGIGAAAFLPAGLALLGHAYRPGPRKNFVFSLYGAFACVGFYFGIFVGALAAEYLTWRWYFWIGAAFGLAVTLCGLATVPASRRLGDSDPAARMDWWGVSTIVPGLVPVVFALTEGGHAPNGWRTPYVYVTLVLGVVLLAAAVYVEGWVAARPLLPAELFAQRYMKRLVGTLFCAYGVFGLFLFYASIYIQTVMGATPILAAAWFTPMAVGGIILAIGGGLVLHMVPNRLLMVISCLGFLLSLLLFALIPGPGGNKSAAFLFWAYIFPAMVGGTVGIDIAFNVTNVFITTAMPRRHQAAAGGLINSLLYLGIAFWLGIVDMAVSARQAFKEEPDETQYRIGFWTGVALSGVALCLTATVKMGQAEAAMTADEQAAMERDT